MDCIKDKYNGMKNLYNEYLKELYERKSSIRKNKIFGKIMKKRFEGLNKDNKSNLETPIKYNFIECKKENVNNSNLENNDLNEDDIKFLYDKSLNENNLNEKFYNINLCSKIITFIKRNLNNEINEYCFIILGNFFLNKKDLYKIEFYNFFQDFLKEFNQEKIDFPEINLINYILWLIQIYIFEIDNKINDNLLINLSSLLQKSLFEDKEIKSKENKMIFNEYVFNILNIFAILFSKNYEINEPKIFLNFFCQIICNFLKEEHILLSLEILNNIFDYDNLLFDIQPFINILNYLFDRFKNYKNENEKIIIYLLIILQKTLFIFQNTEIFSSNLSQTKIIPILIQNYLKEYKLLKYILNILILFFEFSSINIKSIVTCINYNLIEIITNNIQTLNGMNLNITIKYLKLLLNIIIFLKENKIEYPKLSIHIESIKYKLEQFTLHSNQEISNLSNQILQII